MFGEVHFNRVLYKKQPPGAKPVYRQIAVVETGQFEVRIFEGQVVQTNPKFIAESSDAEVFIRRALKQAIADAESEVQQSLASQEWELYNPASPPS